MSDNAKKIREQLEQGECCSRIITRIGLELLGRDNPDMIRASGGLCMGVHSGYLCGALSGAAQILTLFDPENAARHMIPRLMEWFDDEYGSRFTSPNCLDITGGTPRYEICRDIVLQTWEQSTSLLEEFGFELVP